MCTAILGVSLFILWQATKDNWLALLLLLWITMVGLISVWQALGAEAWINPF